MDNSVTDQASGVTRISSLKRIEYILGNLSMVMDFHDLLSCIYVAASEVKHYPFHDELLNGIMEAYTGPTPNITTYHQDVDRMSTKGSNLLAAAGVKVIHHCHDAEKSQILDLSSCFLIQVPVAVFCILKATEIISCNLSRNLITKICPKFGTCFSHITALNLSSNRISSLPNEINNCARLQSVDISSNSFVVFPTILLKIESITDIIANTNFIADVNSEALEQHGNLELVNLEENPLDQPTHARLSQIQGLRVVLTERMEQGWEDLSW